jgi:hypothetical protein
MGALFAPLGVVALVYSRRRKGSNGAILLVILSFAVVTGVTLSGCGTRPSTSTQVAAVIVPMSSQQFYVVPYVSGTPGTPFVMTISPTKTPEQILNELGCDDDSTQTPAPTPTSTPGDNVGLTEAGKKAEKLYQKYAGYTPAQWWNIDGNFTIEEFLGLMLEYDISAETPATDLITEAVARQIWIDATSHEGHPAYCTNNICKNGVFNFIGKYVESAQRRFIYVTPPEEDIPLYDFPCGKSGATAMSDAQNIGEKILHPQAAWKEYSETAPYHWGNPPTPQWALKVHGMDIIGERPDQVYYLGGAHFVVYSIAQDNYWSTRP